MHSALLVLDIVDLILSFLRIEDFPQVSLTCKALHSLAKIQCFRRLPYLHDLISSLPVGLVCEGGLNHLLVYSNDEPDEIWFPLKLSAILPSHHEIYGALSDQVVDMHPPSPLLCPMANESFLDTLRPTFDFPLAALENDDFLDTSSNVSQQERPTLESRTNHTIAIPT